MRRGVIKSERDKNRKFFYCNFFSKNRKGLSEMVGYILLISMTIILSLMVYGWLKTYVPTKSVECTDGASLFMQDFNYTCNTNTLNLTLKNNGRFDLAGYFIHATTNISQALAVTDLSAATPRGSGGIVSYWTGGTQDYNPINAGSTMKDGFNLSGIGRIYSIEIVPMRYELINNRNRPVSCSSGKISEKLSCTIPTTCGNNTIESPEVCDGTALNSQTCQTQGFAGGNLSCKSTCLGFDASQCLIQVCGNGILEGTESCDSTNLNGKTCSSVLGTGWTGTLSCSNTCSFNTVQCTIPDLTIAVTGVVIGTGSNGNKITVTYSISNIGTASASNIFVRVNPGTTSTSPNPPQAGPFSLAAGATLSTITLSWNYLAIGTYNPTITIDPDNTIIESNENNNQATVRATAIVCTSNDNNIKCS